MASRFSNKIIIFLLSNTIQPIWTHFGIYGSHTSIKIVQCENWRASPNLIAKLFNILLIYFKILSVIHISNGFFFNFFKYLYMHFCRHSQIVNFCLKVKKREYPMLDCSHIYQNLTIKIQTSYDTSYYLSDFQKLSLGGSKNFWWNLAFD